jgi:hypothetical protein
MATRLGHFETRLSPSIRSEFTKNSACSMSPRGMETMQGLFPRVAASCLLLGELWYLPLPRTTEGHAHDCANQTPRNVAQDSRRSAEISVARLNARGKSSRPKRVLGGPANPEILVLLFWVDARNESVRGTPSTRTFPDGPFPCPMILFLSDDRSGATFPYLRISRFTAGSAPGPVAAAPVRCVPGRSSATCWVNSPLLPAFGRLLTPTRHLA